MAQRIYPLKNGRFEKHVTVGPFDQKLYTASHTRGSCHINLLVYRKVAYNLNYIHRKYLRKIYEQLF